MKIGNLSMAYAKYQRIAELRQQLASVRGTGLGITIASAYQDAAMVEAVRSAVLAELNRRIEEIMDELESLGLEVDQ